METAFTGKFAVLSMPDRASFSDTEGRWSEMYIESLALAGLASGYSEGVKTLFKPANEITRGEFIKLLVSAKGVELSASDVSMFADADSIAQWQRPYAAAAVQHGWLKGVVTEDGRTVANLDERITRQDAMTLICRAFFEGKTSEKIMSFRDIGDIAPYARDAVRYLTEQNVISGFEDNTFRPLESLTREQVAKVLWYCILIAD